jgi:hypothetical protein
MVKITRIALPKEQLQKLTASERSLFLLSGHASNQINALWKLIVVATNERAKEPVRKGLGGSDPDLRADAYRYYAGGAKAD